MATHELAPSSNVAVHDSEITAVQGQIVVLDPDAKAHVVTEGKSVKVKGEAQIFSLTSARVTVADADVSVKEPRKPRPSEKKAKPKAKKAPAKKSAPKKKGK
jgi:hypothetical protein